MSKPGFVYLFRLGEFHKIGCTRNLAKRAASFATLPYPFEVVHSFYVPDCKRTERALHRHYAGARVKGEWFRLTAEQVADIRTLQGNAPPVPAAERIEFQAPRGFTEEIDAAAAAAGLKRSDYLRSACIRQMAADGRGG